MNEPRYRVFGIRHHGPGSAVSLLAALQDYSPDAILVEGPPEADAVIELAASPQMAPPVALLVYAADEPSKSAFYPFAEFSPEWQALLYALDHAIPARFFDLPQAHMLALGQGDDAADQAGDGGDARTSLAHAAGTADQAAGGADARTNLAHAAGTADQAANGADAWTDLVRAAGAADPEMLWDRLIEARSDSGERFAAVGELMAALREAKPTARFDLIREAWMRRELRGELKGGRSRIAVVCGAWHAPALLELPSAKSDNALTAGLPKVAKVAATWVPWTHGRLTFASGYGAGIDSPGWYEHLWRCSSQPSTLVASWMSQTARVFRTHDLDASPAHAIEATRLAETLAVLRGCAAPGLSEVVDAIQTVFCQGGEAPLRLTARHLIVGERLGTVPDETPEPPLVGDLRREQRRLRLPPEASAKDLELDLRKDNDLERSRLLHRLTLLDVPWGHVQAHTSGTGTFRELWHLAWQPELVLALIEAGRHGNRVEDAALNRVTAQAAAAASLPLLARLLDGVLKAGLGAAVDPLVSRFDEVAAHSADVVELMGALANLAPIARYGDVRKTDTSSLRRIILHLVERITIGLPQACAVNDDAAPALARALAAADQALRLLAETELDAHWCSALLHVADSAATHALVAGRSVRILLDRESLVPGEAARRLGLALSPGVAADEAAWLEGFLAGSGLLLVHRPELLGLLDHWLAALDGTDFDAILPLLRRAFAQFKRAERRQIGEAASAGRVGGADGDSAKAAGDVIDWQRAALVLPLIATYFGVECPT